MKIVKLMACVAGLAMLAACGGGETSSAEAEAPPAAVGQGVQIDEAVFTVTSVKTTKSVGDQYFGEKAGDGAVLVVVKTTTKNTGTKPIPAFSLPQIKLVDAAGVEYSSDGGKTTAYQMSDKSLNQKMLSDLNPDVSQNDAEVFEVSESKFDPATWHIAASGKKFSLVDPSAAAEKK